MSKSAIDYPLEFALAHAERYLADLVPLCEPGYAVIVGSLRRRNPIVHDIEFLVIPKRDELKDMFQAVTGYESHLERDFVKLASQWGAVILKGSGPRLKNLQLAEGIKLQINISDLDRWPVEIVIKTGPEDFTKNCVTQRRKGGWLPSWAVVTDGWKVFNGSRRIEIKTEAEFLEFLGLGWVDPWERTA